VPLYVAEFDVHVRLLAEVEATLAPVARPLVIDDTKPQRGLLVILKDS
jgi:hypothetical protein